MTWVNAVLQGVFLGGYYALLAAGLALMFGLMRIINLAHGDIAVLGAYLIMVVLDHWNVSPFVGLLPVLPVMVAAGYLLQRTVLDRSLRSGMLVPLLTTFGLSIVIQNVLLKRFSPDVRSLGGQAGSIATASWQVTSQITIPALGVTVLAVARMRRPDCVRERYTCRPPRIAAVAGLFLAIRSTFDPFAGPTQLIFAFEAVVIGGLGSLWGTLAGGIVLGVAQTVGAQIDPQYSILAGDLVFLAVLASPRGGLIRTRWAA